MSSYIDIDQLLEQIGASARSAGDPWTLSRKYRTVWGGDSFRPAVIADLGGPLQDLASEFASSEQIVRAATLASSPASPGGTGKSSTGGGFLGGLLSFFPLASGIAKLFGLGEAQSAPVLAPYELPPSIHFEGAVSGPESAVASVSYGANGLPRASVGAQQSSIAIGLPPSVVSNATVESIRQAIGQASVQDQRAAVGYETDGVLRELDSLAAPEPPVRDKRRDLEEQFMTLAARVQPETIERSSTFEPDLLSIPNISSVQAGSNSYFPELTSNSLQSRTEDSAAVTYNARNAQQGQNILVQVQAMDSQSFMDHSHEIAQAVRQAMLNMNSLNDVILDL